MVYTPTCFSQFLDVWIQHSNIMHVLLLQWSSNGINHQTFWMFYNMAHLRPIILWPFQSWERWHFSVVFDSGFVPVSWKRRSWLDDGCHIFFCFHSRTQQCLVSLVGSAVPWKHHWRVKVCLILAAGSRPIVDGRCQWEHETQFCGTLFSDETTLGFANWLPHVQHKQQEPLTLRVQRVPSPSIVLEVAAMVLRFKSEKSVCLHCKP